MFAVSKQVTPLAEEFNENLSFVSPLANVTINIWSMALMQFPLIEWKHNGRIPTFSFNVWFPDLAPYFNTEFEFRYLEADVRVIRSRHPKRDQCSYISYQRMNTFACVRAKRKKEIEKRKKGKCARTHRRGDTKTKKRKKNIYI